MVRHSFPDFEGVKEQIGAMIATERQRKRAEFMGYIEKLPAERTLPLSKENYLLYYGSTTGNTNAICGGGLRPTLLGVKREYDTFDISFREHAGEKWTVLFDPDDMGEVLAVNESGTLRYMLQFKKSMCSLWHLPTAERATQNSCKRCSTITTDWSSMLPTSWQTAASAWSN